MKARYQYRFYPTPEQQSKLSKLFGCCRVVFNDALAFCRNSEKLPKNGDLQKQFITQAKQTEDRQWLSEVSNIPLQQSLRDLNTAYSNFFASLKGKRKGLKVKPPKFKKRSKNGKGVVLTTAKEQEINLLSELAVTRGWGCTIHKRENHGYGKLSWQLSVFPAYKQRGCAPTVTEMTQGEHFWCVKTNNGNFFMRRNGKIHITGNCHGGSSGLKEYRAMDVGYDATGKLLSDYYALIEELKQKPALKRSY